MDAVTGCLYIRLGRPIRKRGQYHQVHIGVVFAAPSGTGTAAGAREGEGVQLD